MNYWDIFFSLRVEQGILCVGKRGWALAPVQCPVQGTGERFQVLSVQYRDFAQSLEAVKLKGTELPAGVLATKHLSSNNLALIPLTLVKLNVLPVFSPKISAEMSPCVGVKSASSLKPWLLTFI